MGLILKLTHILTICDFCLIFGLIISALYVIILVGYIIKMSLQWDIVTAIFPRPFVSGLVASMAYTVRKHLTRRFPGEAKPISEGIPKTEGPIPVGASAEKIKQKIFTHLQTCLQRSKEGEPPKAKRKSVTKDTREFDVLKLFAGGKSVYEISLRLLMDPGQVETTIASLNKKGYINHDLKLTKTGIKKMVPDWD